MGHSIAYCKECGKPKFYDSDDINSKGICKDCQNPETDEEYAARGQVIAGFIQQVALGIDLILIDSRNLDFIETGISDMDTLLQKGYVFPMTNYAKLDRIRENNEVLRAIFELCKVRRIQQDNMTKDEQTFDEVVLRALMRVE